MKKIYLTLLLCLFTFSVFATKYYVSSSIGNDSRNGLSPESAWKTLNKVSSFSFKPGDEILFKSGDVWNESLNISGLKGLENNPIIFSSYGTEPKPIFNTVLEFKSEWINKGGNIWYSKSLGYNPRRLKLNGEEVQKGMDFSQLGQDVSGNSETNVVKWWWGDKSDGGNYLYVYSNVNLNNTKVELSHYPNSLKLKNSEFLNISNLNLIGGYASTSQIADCSFIIMKNLNIGEMSRVGLHTEKNEVDCSNITFDSCDFDSKYTLNFEGAGTASGTSNLGTDDGIAMSTMINGEIKNCLFKNWGHASLNIVTGSSRNKIVTNVKIHNNIMTAPDLGYGGGITLDRLANNCEVYRNLIIDTKYSQINGNDNHIHHNIFKDGKSSPFHNYQVGHGVRMQNYAGNSHENIIENNLFINLEGAGISISSNNKGGPNFGHIIRNNIIYNCGLNYDNIALEILRSNEYPGSNDNNNFENNLIYNSKSNITIKYYGTELNISSFNDRSDHGHNIENNIDDDPKFIDVNSDWHLLEGSPGIDGAGEIRAKFDYESKAIGKNPDIGIYEMNGEDNGTGAIDANAGLDQSICQGESITLTASGGTNYSWNTGATTNSITVSPNSTQTYTVTVSDSNGNSDSDDVIVTVNNVTANAGSDISIDEGDSVILNASDAGGYLWNTGATSQSITVSPLSTQTYSVTVTQNGCEDTDEVKVTVIPNTGSVTANAGKDMSICSGEKITLTASGGSSYSWSNGATTNSTTVSPNSTQTYTVTVSDSNGNSDSDDVIVTVNSVTANAGSDVTIDEGDNVTLTAYGGDSYLWNTGATTSSITVSPASSRNYTVTTSSNGCDDTDTVRVNVNQSSRSVTANAGSDVSICNGENTTLNATGGTSYFWSNGATTSSISVSPSSTQTYTVTVSDSNGNSDTDDVIVTVNSVTANAGSDVTIEEGDNVTLTASGGDSYIWNTGEKSKSINVNPSSSRTYSVTVYKGSCYDIDDVRVNVEQTNNTDPIPAKANAGEDMTICLGESITLSGSGGDSYLWSTGETSSNISVSPNRTATYELTATRGGVTDTDSITITVENCENEIINDEEDLAILEMAVYPNPTKGKLTIQINNLEEDANFIINDTKGSLIYSDYISGEKTQFEKQINLSRYSDGLYFVRLYTAEQYLVKKVMVQ